MAESVPTVKRRNVEQRTRECPGRVDRCQIGGHGSATADLRNGVCHRGKPGRVEDDVGGAAGLQVSRICTGQASPATGGAAQRQGPLRGRGREPLGGLATGRAQPRVGLHPEWVQTRSADQRLERGRRGQGRLMAGPHQGHAQPDVRLDVPARPEREQGHTKSTLAGHSRRRSTGGIFTPRTTRRPGIPAETGSPQAG